jgi:diguanylate cyclase
MRWRMAAGRNDLHCPGGAGLMAASQPPGMRRPVTLQRLRTDFRFAVITLFGTIAILGITPFAVYRFMAGEWLAGWVDTGIVVSIALAVAHVWRGGSMRAASVAVVVATTFGCLWVALLLGLAGLLWMYPVLISHYLLLDRRMAAVVSVAAVGFLLLHGGPFESGLQRAMFLVSAGVTALFAYVFAQRTDRQREQLEALANQDPLTRAANRRALDREMEIAVASQRRGQSGHGLLLLDLDHFKQVNDEYGHEAGDAALVEFVRIVQRASRANDRLFRAGGEEFVVLVTGSSPADLAACAEKLRARVAERMRVDGRPVTVSIGGAVLASGESPQDWLARADAAMYRAKRAGRNRVEIAPRPASAAPTPSPEPAVAD